MRSKGGELTQGKDKTTMRNVVTRIRGLGNLFFPFCVEERLPVVTLRYCAITGL